MATNLRTLELAEAIRKEIEAYLRSMLKVPKPQFVKPLPTMKLVEEIRNDSEKAMTIANHVAKALDQSGIKLRDDETFACMLCVVKKPKYLSELTGIAPEFSAEDPNPEPFAEGPSPEPSAEDPTPEPAQLVGGMVRKMAYSALSQEDFPFTELHAKAWRSIRYNAVMEPAIMEKVTKKRENDRIHY